MTETLHTPGSSTHHVQQALHYPHAVLFMAATERDFMRKDLQYTVVLGDKYILLKDPAFLKISFV